MTEHVLPIHNSALSVSSIIFFRYEMLVSHVCAISNDSSWLIFTSIINSWAHGFKLIGHIQFGCWMFFFSFCSSSFIEELGARAIKRRSRFASRLKCDMRQGERANDQNDQIFCCFMLSQRMKCFVVNDLKFIFNKCTTNSVHWTPTYTLWLATPLHYTHTLLSKLTRIKKKCFDRETNAHNKYTHKT